MNEIDWYEAETHLRVPEDFRRFCQDRKTLSAKRFKIGNDGGSVVRELFVFHGFEESTMFKGWRRFGDQVPARMLPIGFDIGDNLLCLDSRSGKVLWCDLEGDETIAVGKSFADFLASLAPEEEEQIDPVENLGKTGSREDIVAFLQRPGKNAVSRWNRSLAQEAARHGNLEALKACLEAGLNLAECIHLAAMNRHVETVQFLVDIAHVDVNERNSRDWTPLQCARNTPEIFALLQQRGGV